MRGGVVMTGDTSAETNQEDMDLRTVWRLLTVEEQTEFWKYAGQHARELNHNTAVYRELCAAIRDTESNTTVSPAFRIR